GIGTHGKLGPQTLPCPDRMGYDKDKIGWWLAATPEKEGGTMNRKSGAIGLVWRNGKQEALASKGILALGVGLLALALAIVVIVVVMPFADHEVSPGIMADGVIQAVEPDEAFVRSVALVGQSSAGYAAAGPCSSPVCSLSMGPIEAKAYARSVALAGDEAFARGVALAGQSSGGHAAAGPCSSPVCSLSMSPIEAEAYARSVEQAGQGAVSLVGGQ
ncbi:MAG: hypothetical protein P8189_14995, partial [Anaerolineae bacterium]